jgi:phytanoyl-CoA dioxygenase PhyH
MPKVFDQDMRTGKPEEALVGTAARELVERGAVILRGFTRPAHVRAIGTAMAKDAERLRPYSRDHRVRAEGHIGQVPPLRPQLTFSDLVCNPTVVKIASAVFDSGVQLVYYTGHTLMPGAARQPIHLDLGHLWPAHGIAHPPYMLAVNIAVVDVTNENGSMEVWSGSHTVTDPPLTEPTRLILVEEKVDAMARQCHPEIEAERVTMQAGDILLRDMRLWHRGTENRTNRARPMMWSLVATEWYRGGTRARLPIGARAALGTDPVLAGVEWVADDIDYLLLDL